VHGHVRAHSAGRRARLSEVAVVSGVMVGAKEAEGRGGVMVGKQEAETVETKVVETQVVQEVAG